MIKKIQPGSVMVSDWNIVMLECEGYLVELFLGYCYGVNNFRFSREVVEYDPDSITITTTCACNDVLMEH